MKQSESKVIALAASEKTVFSRRQVIFGGLLTVMTVSLLPQTMKKAFAGEMSVQPNDFASVSQMLVGKHELNEALIARAWYALNAKYPDFYNRYQALSPILAKQGLNSIEAVKKSPVFDDAQHRQTIIDIVSGYYLGRVGETHNDTQLNAPVPITYGQALMWKPTLDVTVLPTYARGEPGYWKATPKTIALD